MSYVQQRYFCATAIAVIASGVARYPRRDAPGREAGILRDDVPRRLALRHCLREPRRVRGVVGKTQFPVVSFQFKVSRQSGTDHSTLNW